MKIQGHTAVSMGMVPLLGMLAFPGLAWAAPDGLVPDIPVLICNGPDCAEGEGFLGDAPGHMAWIAEADLGSYICETCGVGEEEGGEEPVEEAPRARDEPPVERELRENPADSPWGNVTPADTRILVQLIERAREHCGTYTAEWRIDCLSSELRATADRLPRGGDYDMLRGELRRSADQLAQIVTANVDRSQPAITRTANVGNRRSTTARPIRRVTRASVPTTNQTATAVLDELSTRLLRSPVSPTSLVAFGRAAQAVDSTKVLLRSV